MKTQKSTLYTILGLLAIFLPLALLGTYQHFHHESLSKIDNPNKDFYYNGSLYFYDDAGELKGKYVCQTNTCDYAKSSIDDDTYNINYSKAGTLEYVNSNNSNYVFISDGDKIYLYSLSNEKVIIEYNALKDYHLPIENNLLIVEQDNKWGVLSLNSFTNVFPYEYDFIGLPDRLINGVLQTDDFIVLSENKWYIYSSDGTPKNIGVDRPIISYNGRYIVTDDKKVYNYQGTLVETPEYVDVYAIENYIIIITSENLAFVYDDFRNSYLAYAQISSYKTLSFQLENNIINVFVDGTMGTTIDLNA